MINAQGNSKKILIVEDDGLAAFSLQRLLERRGYIIVAKVSSSEKAVQAAVELQPDLVLMDIMLSGKMDGVHAAERIQALIDVPTIYLTALSDDATLRRAGVTRPFGYLTKPVIDRDLFVAIEMALYSYRLEKEREQAAKEIQRLNESLEQRVAERTAQLQAANQDLQIEIAERIRAQWELQSSEERFRQLAEHIDEVFWIIASDTAEVLYVSPAFERLWGHACGSLYQQPRSFLNSIHPEDRARISASLDRVSRGDYDEQFRIVRPDGEIRWVRTRAFPVYDEHGQVYRVAGISEDVTEDVQFHQLLEQRVEQRTAELSALLGASYSLASTLDRARLMALILDYLKPVVDYQGAIIFGLEGADLVTLAQRGLVPENQVLGQRFPLASAPAYRQVIEGVMPFVSPEMQDDTLPALQGPLEERPKPSMGDGLSWLGIPLTIKNRAIGMMSLFHDRTNHYTWRHAELALAFANQAAFAIENARLYEQAQELAALQERQRLARDLHDAVSQSLFSASLTAEVLPRLWERNRNEGQRCLAELHQLTRGALAEMRALLLELRPLALAETELGDLLSQLAEAATSRARLPVALNIEWQGLLPPEVQVALYRIAQEALNNVVKHSRASQVQVSLRPSLNSPPSDGGVELCISDDGHGFNLVDVLPRCLGLGIMRERAEDIGATLKIDSQVGHGTRVVAIWSEETGTQQG
jgi:PAS domain S-box-containing protein